MNLNRRYLLKTSALATGGLALTVLDSCISSTHQGNTTGQHKTEGVFSPNIWLEIHKNGKIHFILDKIEMGQSVYTSLAMALAEELDVDPQTFSIAFAHADRKYGNPKLMGLQMTGGSTSVSTSIEPLRQAGAAARSLLIRAASKRWGVAESSCQTSQGLVLHQESGRQLTYGDLAEEAAQLPIPETLKLKSKDQWKYLGKPQTRLDGFLKVQGQAPFGIDVNLPDALAAVLIRPPFLGAELVSWDAAQAEKIPGVKKIFSVGGGIAVVAEKFHQARKASALVQIQWKSGNLSDFSTEKFMEELDKRASLMLKKAIEEGSFEIEIGNPLLLEASYELPFLAHATLEPQNATALVHTDGIKIWAPTQAPGLLQHMVAALTKTPVEKVEVFPTFLGGGFGRRLAQDYGIEAVMIALHFNVPVKLIWSREDDTQHDFYRPAMVHKLKASILRVGEPKIQSWAHGASGPSILAKTLPTWIPALVPHWLPSFLVDEMKSLSAKIFQDWKLIPDSTSMEGASTIPYKTEVHTHHYDSYNPGIPVGFWRSVGHSHTCFAVESFLDEIAHSLQVDPMDYRLSLLKDHPRHRAVLQTLRKISPWDDPNRGFLGLALHESFGSIVGEVAEIEVVGQEIRVRKFWLVIDCGQAINPLHIEAQMMSSVIFGITATLFSNITFKNGAVEQSSFDDYPLLRANQIPSIQIEIMQNDHEPSGVGEPGVPPVAPAIANAVFRATGKRLRRLPLRLT